MSLLDNAIKHFSDSANNELHKIDVPEWDESVWFKSISSMNGIAYQRYMKAAQEADFSSLVDVLILRARREDGIKAFNNGDKKALMATVSPDVITSIVNSMASIDNAESEDVKKS